MDGACCAAAAPRLRPRPRSPAARSLCFTELMRISSASRQKERNGTTAACLCRGLIDSFNAVLRP